MRRVALLLSLLLMLTLGLGTGLAQQEGTISGRVVNRTPGGGPVAGLEVTLTALGPSGSHPSPQTAQTDAQGSFRFSDLKVSTDYSYSVSVTYATVRYANSPVRLTPEAPSAEVELPVYETTSAADAVRVSFEHMVMEINARNGALVATEYLVVSNRGDRTYVGLEAESADAPRFSLRFPLPGGAVSLDLGDGLTQEGVALVPNGFAITSPLPPGDREITFSYALPYSGQEYRLEKVLPYATERLTILVPDVGVGVESPSLTPGQNFVVGDQQYILLQGQGLADGAPVEVRFLRLPLPQEQEAPLDGLKSPATALAVALGLGLALAAYLRLRRRRQRQSSPRVATDHHKERSELLWTLAELDQRYEAGEVPEEEYRRQRADFKKRLEKLW